jgi:hypothetical protein
MQGIEGVQGVRGDRAALKPVLSGSFEVATEEDTQCMLDDEHTP